MHAQQTKEPKSRRGLIIKRTTAVWAILLGLVLMEDRITYDKIWTPAFPLFSFALIIVLIPEAYRESREKRRLKREKKKRARETAAREKGLLHEAQDPIQEERGPASTQRIDQEARDLRAWFEQYNPLVLLSAASLLLGFLIVSLGLQKTSWRQGQLALTGVVQLYEIFLLAGATLLFRNSGLHRPGLVLILLESLFLFDCTFRTEVMASLGRRGLVLSAGWLILVASKLAFVKWLLRLKCPGRAILFPALAALGVAGAPYAMRLGIIPRETIQWIAAWCGAGLLSWALWLPPKLKSDFAGGEKGEAVLQRIVRFTLILWAGLYLLHLFSWGALYALPITLTHIMPFYLIWFFSRKREIWRWCGGLGAAAAALSDPATASPMALFVGIIFLFQAWHNRKMRLSVPGILCLYLAAWSFGWQQGPLPEARLWLNILTALILALMAWRFRLLSAAAAIVPVMLPGARDLIPHGSLQWGIFVFALGLVALIVGVLINLSHKKSVNDSGSHKALSP
ncbi:MAG: hypothetical protein ABII06_18580 [Pseudomonadota bacterium]